jgi:hypothetical protein
MGVSDQKGSKAIAARSTQSTQTPPAVEHALFVGALFRLLGNLLLSTDPGLFRAYSPSA